MANAIDLSGLTLNPEEKRSVSEFILEQVFNKPELRRLHGVQTGVKMKEQIVFASQFGKTGLKADACTRQTSGAKSTLTQKYWEPVGIEDTIVHCNKELNSLFKAYFAEIQRYREVYDIQGSPLAELLVQLLENTITNTIYRAAWFGDTAVGASGAATPGLIDDATNGKFYDYLNGLWKQIFAGVTATTIKRYTIALNAQVTKAAQLNLAANAARDTYFESIWALADARLKAHPDSALYVSGEIWENYRKSLQASGENFTIEYRTDGFRELKWNGKPVINMETIWDLDARVDFENNSTDHAYYLPNKIVFTIPANIPIGTLNESDFTELENWYNIDLRTNNTAYGFSLDAKVLEDYMMVVGY